MISVQYKHNVKLILMGNLTWSKCLCPTWNMVCNNLVGAGRDAVDGTRGGAEGVTSPGSRAPS
jgi:hypothetical protein